MSIDPDIAIGAALPQERFAWSESDVLLYHLGVGAGARPGDALDPRALRWSLDDEHLQVLPSFGVVAPNFHDTKPPRVEFPGCEIDLSKVLHGAQSIEVAGSIPAAGEAVLHSRIADIWDKGTAAVIVREGEAISPAGQTLWTVRSSIFVRDAGGFGGERGPSSAVSLPQHEPDYRTTYAVLPQQALLYRLCGDRNPLHADPAFAAGAGFAAPILHGLCSYGIVLRELIDGLLEGDAAAVRGFSARFAGIVYPGETIEISAWSQPGQILAAATIAGGERAGSPVLADCALTV